MNENDIINLSDKELQDLLFSLRRETERRAEAQKEKLWNEVKNAIENYTKAISYISIQDYTGEVVIINSGNDFDECGVINIPTL